MTSLDGLGATFSEFGDASTDAGSAGVVVPVFMRKRAEVSHLKLLLHALQKQTTLPEVIVLVDDSGPLQVVDVLRRNMHGWELNEIILKRLVLLRMDRNRGPAAARNEGIRYCHQSGVEVVCFTDLDCIPTPEWVGEMLEAQREFPGLIGGLTLSTLPGSLVGWFHDAWGTLNGRLLRDDTLLYGCTCNLSMPLKLAESGPERNSRGSSRLLRTAAEGAGVMCRCEEMCLLFDTDFKSAAFEDVDLCVRARMAGMRTRLHRGAVVQHTFIYSLRGLFQQFFRYGQAEAMMLEKHPSYGMQYAASVEVSNLWPLRRPEPASAGAT